MDIAGKTEKPTLGFLTVVEHPQYGLFGGYLILNTAGRPLEFHCTTPIKPNRAQEILYGPTLEAFLYGEQIGQTLIARGSVEPRILCTDRPAALAAQEFTAAPVVLVMEAVENAATPEVSPASSAGSSAGTPTQGRFFRIDGAHRGPRLVIFERGPNRLALPEAAGRQKQLVESRLAELGESFDLAEPFQRIRDAIEEAQQAVRG